MNRNRNRTAIASGLFALVAACGGGGDDYAVKPPGMNPPPGNNQTPDAMLDAPSDGGSGSGATVGRVCVVSDPRALRTCDTTGADGLQVSAGAVVTTTGSDGAFALDGIDPLDPITVATGSGALIIEPSAGMPGATQIPAIPLDLYQEMLSDSGVDFDAGLGAVIAHVSRGGGSLSGATAQSLAAEGNALYDSSSPTVWAVATSTGAAGEVWLPSMDVGTVMLTIVPGSAGSGSGSGAGSAITISGIATASSVTTFVDVTVP